MKVCCFSGGRGAQSLIQSLSLIENIDLTVVINGYDDGKSTGRIRGAIKDFLGPSDFRKILSAVSIPTSLSHVALAEMFEHRLSVEQTYSPKTIYEALFADDQFCVLIDSLESKVRSKIIFWLNEFSCHIESLACPVAPLIADMAVGNLIFGGCYLNNRGDFNKALSALCSLFRTNFKIVSATQDGGNLTLAAILTSGKFLLSEAEIVENSHDHKIHQLFFIDTNSLDTIEKSLRACEGLPERTAILSAHSKVPKYNKEAFEAIQNCDLLIFPPGTQYSSLLPSYLICSEALLSTRATKRVLVSNLDPDNDIRLMRLEEILEEINRYIGPATPDSTNPSITHLLVDQTTTIPYSLEALSNFAQVHIGPLRSRSDVMRHSGSEVRSAILNIYYQSSDRRSIRVAYAEDIGASLKIGISQSFYDGNAVDAKIAFSPIMIRHSDGGHKLFNQKLILEINHWLHTSREDFFVVVGFDGVYESSDAYLLIDEVVRSNSTAAVGHRFRTSLKIAGARRASYEGALGLQLISMVGGAFLNLIFRIRFGANIGDPLSGLSVFSASEMRRLEIKGCRSSTVPGFYASILRAGGSITQQYVSYLPLGGFRGFSKILLSAKVLVDIVRVSFER